MKITITINMDNAAFAESDNTTETVRIIRALCDKLSKGGCLFPDDSQILMDYNGNTVGKFVVSE